MTMISDDNFIYVINGVVTPITCIFGIIGNVLSILVLKRIQRRSKNVANMLLQVLAVFDTIFLLGGFFPMYAELYRKQHLCLLATLQSKVQMYMEITWNTLAMVAHTLATWIIVLLTFERFIGIRFPMRQRKLCSPRKLGIVIAIGACLAILYNGVTLFECHPKVRTHLRSEKMTFEYLHYMYTTNEDHMHDDQTSKITAGILGAISAEDILTLQHEQDHDHHNNAGMETLDIDGAHTGTNETSLNVDNENSASKMTNNQSFDKVLENTQDATMISCLHRDCVLSRSNHAFIWTGTVLNSILRFAGPAVFVFSLNMCIIHSMRRTVNRIKHSGITSIRPGSMHRRKRTLDNNEVRNFNRMCVVVSMTFFTCMIPTNMNFILGLTIFREGGKDLPHWHIKYDAVSDYLIIVNSAVNFVTYCAMRRGFRQQIRLLLCRNGPRNLRRRSNYNYTLASSRYSSSSSSSSLSDSCQKPRGVRLISVETHEFNMSP